MKRVYPMVIAIYICMTLIILPRISFAQCTCAGGIPATAVSQVVKVDTNTAPTVLITFNKFTDTSTNTPHEALTCMTIFDTMTVVSSTGVLNTIPSTQSNVIFKPDVNYTIKGPGGLFSFNDNNTSHGPYTLGPVGTPSDSVFLGPDTLFNKVPSQTTPSNVAPYFGTGTVSDTVAFGGGTTTINGNNFTFTEKAKYWGTFRITYYWCPQVILATSITDFTATQNGNSILLQWLTNNEQNNSNYEIQVSTDGKQFSSAGEAQSDPATAGATSKHQYQYNTDQINVGKLYFRIKQTDASGKVSYSAILIITPGGSGDAPTGFQTYPNPAVNSLVFQFNSNQTGHYLLELVNTAGQIVQRKSATLTGTNQIRMDLNPHPAKGLYFMRTSDLTHNQSYVSKVLIN